MSPRKHDVPDELLSRLLANYQKPEDLIGENGLLKRKRPVTTPSATQVWSTALSSFPRGEGRWVYWEGRRVR